MAYALATQTNWSVLRSLTITGSAVETAYYVGTPVRLDSVVGTARSVLTPSRTTMKVLRRRPERTSQNRASFLDVEGAFAVAEVGGKTRVSSLLSFGVVVLDSCGVVMGGV